MRNQTVWINGIVYEVIPVSLASTIPDDCQNMEFLFDALKSRLAARGLVEVETEQKEFAEVRQYTVLLLKRI